MTTIRLFGRHIEILKRDYSARWRLMRGGQATGWPWRWASPLLLAQIRRHRPERTDQ